jgi:CRP/FNR family transcriptional regulator
MDVDTKLLSQHFPGLTSQPLLDEIRQAGLPAQLPQGATICHQGQQCTHLALVVEGSARVYQLAESGREITLYRVAAGEACILTASCIMSQQRFPAVAVCETATEAVLIPAAKVDEWMGSYSQWRHFVWTLMANRLSGVLCLLEEVTFRRVDQRIATYLLEKSAQQPSSPLLMLTHQTIADDLGTSREVVSRILKDLEHQKAVTLSRGRVEVHPARLRERLGQCD